MKPWERLQASRELSIIALAAPAIAGSGPAAPVTAAILGLITAVELFTGRAHLDANELTRPGQGPQWIWEKQTLPGIIDPLTQKRLAGTWTRPDVEEAIKGVKAAREVVLKAIGLLGESVAARQARKTVDDYTETALANLQRDLDSFPPSTILDSLQSSDAWLWIVAILVLLVILYEVL